MIRVLSILPDPDAWIGTYPRDSTVEVTVESSAQCRIPRNPDGSSIKFFASQTTRVRQLQATSRIRIIVGPTTLAREIDDINRFLIAKGLGTVGQRIVKPATQEKYTTALKLYAQWLETHWNPSGTENNYLNFYSSHPLGRPTYAYRDYLLRLSGISSSTKNSRMSAVRSFYEHLEYRGVISGADVERYQTFDRMFLRTNTTHGASLTKSVRVSDLRIPNGKSKAIPTLKNTVVDDGIIRPLSTEEIAVVLAVLEALDNPILRLASFFALNTGARLQTVLT
ncbi:MAG: hypothetical protein WBO47_11495, partial [Gammaproteobacteria bacterium]